MNNLLYYSLNHEGKHLTGFSIWKVDGKYRDMKMVHKSINYNLLSPK